MSEAPPVRPPLPPELVNYPNQDHRSIEDQVVSKSIGSTRTLLCNRPIVMISANGAVVYPLRELEYGSPCRLTTDLQPNATTGT